MIFSLPSCGSLKKLYMCDFINVWSVYYLIVQLFLSIWLQTEKLLRICFVFFICCGRQKRKITFPVFMLMSSKIENQKTMLISVFEFFSDLWISDHACVLRSSVHSEKVRYYQTF